MKFWILKLKIFVDGIEKGELSVFVKKQKIIRHIPLSEKSVKILKKLIDGETDTDGYFIHKKNSVRNNLNPIGFTKDFNQLIQLMLGKNYSTHSFRKGIIKEMGLSGINIKLIQTFVSHKNISTTLNYIAPSYDDIRNCLLR